MPEQRLEVTETSDEQVTVEFDGLTISLWRSSLDKDRGQPVVQIDGSGMLRVNVNDYPIWNADPNDHEHHECLCVTDFEAHDQARDNLPLILAMDDDYCPTSKDGRHRFAEDRTCDLCGAREEEP